MRCSPSSARSPTAPAAPPRKAPSAPSREILAEGVEAASHFSCIGATARQHARAAGAPARRWASSGWWRCAATCPAATAPAASSSYASDLVAFIRAETGDDFRIEVACYPEMHPQARSPEADLQAFAAKVRAGADAGDHAVLLQRRRLLPLRRRGCARWACTSRWCRASCRSPAPPS